MEIKKITVGRPHGLHLRTAAELVKLSRRFDSKIFLCRKCQFADSCSILELLSLGASRDEEIGIIAEGPDEKTAVRELEQFFSDGAGI
jgi:phosphotransferase system HPr (HPr) family protein